MTGLSFIPVNLEDTIDLRLCAEMRAATYAASGRKAEYFDQRWASLDKYGAYLSQHVGHDPRYVTLVSQGDEVIGHVIANHHKEFEDCGYIETLYVKPKHRGQRLGLKILDYIEKIFRTHGMTRARLTSHADFKKLTQFYATCGYQKLGLADDKSPPLLLWEKTLNA